ncbi:MAG: S8 family serine peptidase [Prevotella sp.]|nr:S8 family serine peptidase [Prevotella sp.]
MRRLFLTAIFVGVAIIGFAQNENKYSASTLMFLSEQLGETELPKLNEKQDISEITTMSGAPKIKQEELGNKRFRSRPIAAAEMVNGVKMISAFIGVKDNDFSGLEELGVIFEAKFNNLATTLIPVSNIEKVAALENVTRIEVAEILEPYNDQQRAVTRAYDAITNSSAAQALGITSPYTGKGVILGIIDTGIDFQHIAFKDKNGNSRIVRAYKLSGSNSTSLTTYSSSTQISSLTYDTNAEDHGTHTSTTAGGSSVIVNGSTVTVTDDHANATYGGMAPEADLVIAGLSSLYTTSIGTAIQNICNYADQVGKPCVISLSLGSQVGPHDGTGSIASIVNSYAGNNHIIVYAASNDGMRADAFVEMGTSNGGGMYASGTSTSSKPMIVNVQRSFSNADGNVEMLMPTITAYARTAGVATSLKFHVVNVNTGAIVYSSSAYSSSTTIDLTGSTGLAQYFKSSSSYSNQYGDAGKIRITRTQDTNNNKYYWQIYAPIMLSTSYADSDGDGVYNSDYAFCVSVYPASSSSSTVIDMWEGYASWFGTDLNLSSSSYNYCKGNDECSVSDNACYSKVISVGAYVSKNQITNYSGSTYDFTDEYPNIGDHANFSSWQTTGYGPLGTALPTINAPGARIVAGVNHYHTASVDSYSYYGDTYSSDLVVNNTNYPYAAMEGTSMATPCVSGIIAQWLQACVEVGKTPTPDYIKEVMQETWITDEWTNGTGSGAHGAKTFGTHGKIDAIAGLQYILGVTGGSPELTATPDELTFSSYTGQEPATMTFTVTGTALRGDVSLALTDPDNVFSLSTSTVGKSEAQGGKEITVSFNPEEAGSYTGIITLSSESADDVAVSLAATAEKGYQDVTISGYGVSTLYLDFPVAIPYLTYDPDLLGVFIAYEMTGSEVKLARLRHNIPPYTGVLVQGNAGTYRSPRIADGEVIALTRENLLTGTTASITVDEAKEAAGAPESSIVMTLGQGRNGYIGFYQYSGSTLGANKAYLIYDSSAGAKGLTFSVEGENDQSTGINLINVGEEKDGSWYNIQGQRLFARPVKRGVYIRNGKVVLVK